MRRACGTQTTHSLSRLNLGAPASENTRTPNECLVATNNCFYLQFQWVINVQFTVKLRACLHTINIALKMIVQMRSFDYSWFRSIFLLFIRRALIAHFLNYLNAHFQ